MRGFDITFKKFLNPDINRDSIYDYEEDLSWMLGGFFTRQFEVQSFPFDGLMTLSPDVLMNPHYHGPEIMPGHYPQYYFDMNSITSQGLPLNGDFILNIEGTECFTENVEFTRPSENYEGYVFPFFNFSRNATGAFTTISWRWMSLKNGQIVDAIPEEVQVKARAMFFYLWEAPQNFRPEYFGVDYWENSSLYADGTVPGKMVLNKRGVGASYLSDAQAENSSLFYVTGISSLTDPRGDLTVVDIEAPDGSVQGYSYCSLAPAEPID